MNFQQLGGRIKFSELGFGNDMTKTLLDFDPADMEKMMQEMLNDTMQKVQQFTLNEELEMNFNNEFNLKSAKGGEISGKMAISGKTTPMMMTELQASNEA